MRHLSVLKVYNNVLRLSVEKSIEAGSQVLRDLQNGVSRSPNVRLVGVRFPPPKDLNEPVGKPCCPCSGRLDGVGRLRLDAGLGKNARDEVWVTELLLSCRREKQQ